MSSPSPHQFPHQEPEVRYPTALLVTLGVVQLILAAIAVVLQIVIQTAGTPGSDVSAGIWAGIFFVFCAVCTFWLSRNTSPGWFVLLGFVAIATMGIAATFMGLSAVGMGDTKDCVEFNDNPCSGIFDNDWDCSHLPDDCDVLDYTTWSDCPWKGCNMSDPNTWSNCPYYDEEDCKDEGDHPSIEECFDFPHFDDDLRECNNVKTGRDYTVYAILILVGIIQMGICVGLLFISFKYYIAGKRAKASAGAVNRQPEVVVMQNAAYMNPQPVEPGSNLYSDLGATGYTPSLEKPFSEQADELPTKEKPPPYMP